ncbi:MAG: rhomboid family intramembrane serine protease [Erysipelotrichaceae bacterium]
MKFSKNDVYAIQLMYYFMKQQEYQVVSVRQNKHDIWLANPKREELPVIHINSKPVFNENEETKYVQNVYRAVLDLIQREGKLLNINTIDIDFKLDNPAIEEIEMWNEHISDETIKESFNGIETAIKEVDETKIQEEFAKTTIEIERITKAKRKEEMKKNRFIPKVSIVFILICCIAYGIEGTLINHYGFDMGIILSGAMYKPLMIVNGEWYRMLSAGFLHLNLFHLFMNTIALYNMGTIAERMYNKKQYVFILLMSILMGNALSFIANGNVIALGISGGVFGVMGAMLVNFIDTGAFKNKLLRTNVIMLVFINFLISMGPGIDAFGHIGGFVIGAALGILFTKSAKLQPYKIHVNICYAILIVVSIYLVFNTHQLNNPEVEVDKAIIETYKGMDRVEEANKFNEGLKDLYN